MAILPIPIASDRDMLVIGLAMGASEHTSLPNTGGTTKRKADTDIPYERIEVRKRIKPIAVEHARLGFVDKAPQAQKRDEIRERWRHAARKLKLLTKYGLMYTYKNITENEIRLLYLKPAFQYEDDLHIELKTIADELTGPQAPRQEYEALSYHWGPAPAVNPVYVSAPSGNPAIEWTDVPLVTKSIPDFKKGQRFFVRRNLDKALRYLRDKKNTVVLWVDALCINQADERVEKPAQIAKMKHIYNKASNVCIWLGDGKEESDTGILDRSEDFLAAMAFSGSILNLKKFEDHFQEPFTKKWSDLMDLMRSSWFSRRWVIQELALAREATVHCGTGYVSWQDFADAIGLFALNFDRIRGLLRQSKDDKIYNNFLNFNALEPLGAKLLVDAITNTFRKSVDGGVFEPVSNLETLVSSLASFESSDPRDSIFALLNIAQESLLPTIEGVYDIKPPVPNYGRDLLEVYTDFLEWVVYSSGSLDIICRQWATPERQKVGGRKNPTDLVTLPSWIQTIQKSAYGTMEQGFNGRVNGDSLVGRAGRRRYNASHGMKPEVQFGQRWRHPSNIKVKYRHTAPSSFGENKESTCTSKKKARVFPNGRDKSAHRLHARGMVIGTTEWTSSPVSRGVITQDCLMKGGWVNTDEPKIKVPDKLWRTMVADRDATGNNTPPWYHRAALHCMVLADNNGHIGTAELLDGRSRTTGGHPHIVNEYLKRVQAVTWNRKFLEGKLEPQDDSSEQLFGIGPPDTRPGDKICILFGCSVPCILRPCEIGREDTYFEFVGEAYIYGRMDGEAIKMVRDGELDVKEFTII